MDYTANGCFRRDVVFHVVEFPAGFLAAGSLSPALADAASPRARHGVLSFGSMRAAARAETLHHVGEDLGRVAVLASLSCHCACATGPRRRPASPSSDIRRDLGQANENDTRCHSVASFFPRGLVLPGIGGATLMLVTASRSAGSASPGPPRLPTMMTLFTDAYDPLGRVCMNIQRLRRSG